MDSILTNPQAVGIMIDIIGAYFLSRGFIFADTRELIAQSWGTDDKKKNLRGGLSGNLFVGFYRQMNEARAGFIVLTVGFILQLIGTISLVRFSKWLGLIMIIASFTIPYIVLKYLLKHDRVERLMDDTDNAMSAEEDK